MKCSRSVLKWFNSIHVNYESLFDVDLRLHYKILIELA